MRVQVRRLAVRLAAARASTSTSADKTKKDQIHRTMVSITSRTFSEGCGVGRRELCLRTGEQQRQAYYLSGGVLIIDNFAHSSRAVAIICFAFVTTLQDRPPASMSIRNVVSSVFRTALSAFCLLHALQYPVHNPRLSFLSPTTPSSSPRASKSTCSRTRHTVLSNLSTGSACILLCHLVHKRSSQCRSL